MLDERTRPDFREIYGWLLARSRQLDVALTRIRLSTLDLRGPACGRRLVARIIPDNRLDEAKTGNNTAVVRIRGPS